MITRRSIETMLTKKTLAGEKVGRVLIADGIYGYKRDIGNKEKKELISREEYLTLLSKVVTNEERDIHSNYVGLTRWTSNTTAMCSAHLGAFEIALSYFKELIMATHFTVDVVRYIKSLPRILTEAEYEAKKQATIKEATTGNNTFVNVFNLLEMALSRCCFFYKTNRLENEALEDVFIKYSTERVQSPLILNNYNRINKVGYSTLEDGRRSDQMSAEEWQEAITKPEYKKALTAAKKHKKVSMQEMLQMAATSLEGHVNGNTQALYLPTTFHIYQTPPASLTKLAFLKEDKILDFYSEPNLNGLSEEEKAATMLPIYKDFLEEFKEALDVIMDEIKDRYQIDLKSVPIEEWYTKKYETQSLVNLNYFKYKEELLSDINVFDGDITAIDNGIAILRPSDIFYTASTIEQGTYKAPCFSSKYFANIGLERFTSSNPGKAKELQELNEKIEDLADEIYYLNAVTVVMDLIAKRIKIPEYNVFAPDINRCLLKLQSLEILFQGLYIEISKLDESQVPNKQEKLALLRDKLFNISKVNLTISEDKLKIAKEKINAMTVFTLNMDELGDMLYYRE